MSLFHQLYREQFLPRYESSRFAGIGPRWKALQEAERTVPAKLKERQWQRTQELLRHAYETTAFYRQRFDQAGLKPADIKAPVDLQRLPFLTRDDLRIHREAMVSSTYRREELLESATGGTTDTPVTLLRSPECIRARVAAQFRFHSWAGIELGDKVFWLWGALGDFAQAPSWKWRMWDRYVMRRQWAQTSRLNDEVMAQHLDRFNAFRPKGIMAYPTPLALFCEYLQRTGKRFHRPRAAMVTAEVLLPEQRDIIRNVLGCDPFVQYGTRDFGMIAGECEQHNGLHLNPESAFVELLPVDGAGPDGLHELVITDLTNLAMPMIRYRINDCALPAPAACACGRGYPLVREIVGRTTDNFYLADGTVVSGVVLPGRILKACPQIRKMQIIQETYEDFQIRYIPGEGFSTSDLEPVAGKLQQYVGQARVRFERVDEIPREASGKTRFFISKVKRAAGAR